MTTSQPPDTFDYDELSAQIMALAKDAIARGADPKFTAVSVLQDSYSVAFEQGPAEAFHHILFSLDRAEEDMRKFHERFAHVLDLDELVHGRVVPKVG